MGTESLIVKLAHKSAEKRAFGYGMYGGGMGGMPGYGMPGMGYYGNRQVSPYASGMMPYGMGGYGGGYGMGMSGFGGGGMPSYFASGPYGAMRMPMPQAMQRYNLGTQYQQQAMPIGLEAMEQNLPAAQQARAAESGFGEAAVNLPETPAELGSLQVGKGFQGQQFGQDEKVRAQRIAELAALKTDLENKKQRVAAAQENQANVTNAANLDPMASWYANSNDTGLNAFNKKLYGTFLGTPKAVTQQFQGRNAAARANDEYMAAQQKYDELNKLYGGDVERVTGRSDKGYGNVSGQEQNIAGEALNRQKQKTKLTGQGGSQLLDRANEQGNAALPPAPQPEPKPLNLPKPLPPNPGASTPGKTGSSYFSVPTVDAIATRLAERLFNKQSVLSKTATCAAQLSLQD